MSSSGIRERKKINSSNLWQRPDWYFGGSNPSFGIFGGCTLSFWNSNIYSSSIKSDDIRSEIPEDDLKNKTKKIIDEIKKERTEKNY